MPDAVTPLSRWAAGSLWLVLTLSGILTVATWLTAGFRVDPLGIRISSSSVLRPLAIGAVAGWLLARDRRQRERLHEVFRKTSLPLSALACAAFAWTHAAPVAAAADMFGYVSQAGDWWHGSLIRRDWIDDRFFPAAASVPLGYLYRNDAGPVAIALYPPGTSVHMALFSVAGEWAMYLVSPAGAVALVVGAYALGRRWFDETTACVAAAVVACNPVVLIQAAVPMSDTLAAAYWTWSLVLAGGSAPWMPWGAGLLAGIAIAVRPNLAPLLVGPLGSAWIVSGLRGAVGACVGVVPVAGWLAWHNQRLYGGASATGYGPVSLLFSTTHIAQNVRNYATWLVQTMSPLPLVGFLWSATEAIGRRQVRLMPLLALAAANVAIYLVYLPWPQWTFARFLMPALPIVVLMAASLARRVTNRRPVVFPVLVLIVLAWQLDFAQRSALRNSHESLMRFKVLPEALRARNLAGQPAISRVHSGSLRHYAGMATVRWDVISPDELRDGIAAAIAAGHRPMIIDDSDDRADFEQRFGSLACWADTAAPLLEIRQHATIRVLAARPGCR